MAFDGNKIPLTEQDMFGFLEVAEQIASAAISQTGTECFVLGIEGEWGSGKSSLLTITEEILHERKSSVVQFNPWLIGSREALLVDLFSGLEKAITNQKIKKGNIPYILKSAVKTLKAYSNALSILGQAASIAGVVGLPYANQTGSILSKLSKILPGGNNKKTLSELKKKTSEELMKLSSRIIVSIDDLDRLEPKDAVEVPRLVQAVADFPNITYLLCYDRERLAQSIKSITQTKDGLSFIEKIVHLTVSVPRPQPSDLRHMFMTKLSMIIKEDRYSEARLTDVVVTHIGSRLRTPRAVVRALDLLRLLWPKLRGKVDLADLVWLQFIRIENERFYRWIEEYTAEIAHFKNGKENKISDPERFVLTLKKMRANSKSLSLRKEEIANYLPIDEMDPKKLLFKTIEGKEAKEAYYAKRLKSPDHSRLYFGLLSPKGAMTEDQMYDFVKEAHLPSVVASKLLELAKKNILSGPSQLEIVLEQITSSSELLLDSAKAAGFVSGTLAVADDLIALTPPLNRAILSQSLATAVNKIWMLVSQNTPESWIKAALKTAKAVTFFTMSVVFEPEMKTEGSASESEEVPEDLGQDPPDWGDTARKEIELYLIKSYTNLTAEELIKRTDFNRIISVWKKLDLTSLKKLHGQIATKDPLLSEYLVKYWHAYTQSEFGYEAGKVFFAIHTTQLWDKDNILSKMDTLISKAKGNNKSILEIIGNELSACTNC